MINLKLFSTQLLFLLSKVPLLTIAFNHLYWYLALGLLLTTTIFHGLYQ